MTRLRLLFLLVALGLAASASAQTAGCAGFALTPVEPYAFETITVSTAAVGFTASNITTTTGSQAIMAVFSVEAADLRFREDGTAPTSSVGHYYTATSQALVCGRTSVINALFIRAGGSDSTIQVTYYRRKQ